VPALAAVKIEDPDWMPHSKARNKDHDVDVHFNYRDPAWPLVAKGETCSDL
jgi:hypothetical protein